MQSREQDGAELLVSPTLWVVHVFAREGNGWSGELELGLYGEETDYFGGCGRLVHLCVVHRH